MAGEKEKIVVVSAAIERDGRYLITQRKAHAVLPLLWEFPGGRVRGAATDEALLRTLVDYRLGVQVRVLEEISVTEKEYSEYIVHLKLFRCELVAGEPTPLRVEQVQWVSSSQFDDFEFTPADETSMNALLEEDRETDEL